MLTFFTNPHPDELLHSIWGRYMLLTGFNKNAVEDTLFGTKSGSIDLKLDYLCKNLGECYTPNYFLKKHSLYNFYSKFRSSKNKNVLITLDGLTTKVGSNYTGGSEGYSLKYCPICAKNDIQNYGEAFFHREHQISEVPVCPHHMVYLYSYESESRNSYLWLDKDKITFDCNEISPDELIYLIKIIHEVLKDDDDSINSELLSAKYMQLLIEQGYANEYCQINQKKLISNMDDFFHFDYINRTFLHFIDQDYLKGVLNAIYSNQYCKPIYHILLIHFLVGDYKELLKVHGFVRETKSKCVYKAKQSQEKTSRYKEQILATVTKYPGLKRSDYRKMCLTAFQYLNTYDSEYINNILPGKKTDNKKIIVLNDKEYDENLLKSLKDAYNRLLEKRVKITKTRLLIEANSIHDRHRINDLPLSKKYIEQTKNK